MYTKEEMKAEILAHERIHDDISFVTMMRLFGADARGENTIFSSKFPNVVFWTGLSADLCDAIQELLREGKLIWEVSEIFVYAMEGGRLQMPIVTKQGLKKGYKKPHWAPMLLVSPRSHAKWSKRLGRT